jgi:hypothetical protein
MEKRFEQLEIENGFSLEFSEAIAYLDWCAQEHTKQVMKGEEGAECMEAILEDLFEMKKEIIDKGYEVVQFYECPASASNINIEPLIYKRKLDYAIENVAEWAMNNCDLSDSVPLIFEENNIQKQFEKYIKEKQER